MSDDKVTIKELQEKVVQFRAARKWNRNPKDMAITISVESNELLELFQFNKWQETNVDAEIKKELADVLIGCLEFASERHIDISEAVHEKLQHLEKKFPLETFKDGGASEEYHRIRKHYRQPKPE